MNPDVPGVYSCTFQPHDIGDHKLNVKYGGQEVSSKPHILKSAPSGNADKCVIKGLFTNVSTVNALWPWVFS